MSLCECTWEGERVGGGKQEGVGEKRKRQGHDGEMVMEWECTHSQREGWFMWDSLSEAFQQELQSTFGSDNCGVRVTKCLLWRIDHIEVWMRVYAVF